MILIYYILLGRILQLPRGKGHKRTSRSHSKVPYLTPPPPIRIRKTATAPGSPYSFRIVRGFFTSHRIINIQGIVRRDLRLIVLISAEILFRVFDIVSQNNNSKQKFSEFYDNQDHISKPLHPSDFLCLISLRKLWQP